MIGTMSSKKCSESIQLPAPQMYYSLGVQVFLCIRVLYIFPCSKRGSVRKMATETETVPAAFVV